MDLESIMHSEINQTEKDKYSMLSPMCGTLKKKRNEYNKTETDSQMQKTNEWLPLRRGEEEGQDGDTASIDTNHYV